LKSEAQHHHPNSPVSNNQRFYTDAAKVSDVEPVQVPQQQALTGKEIKTKVAKARKPATPKNPNTPKRRKTTSGKEKINQMPADQLLQQNSSDSIAANPLNSSANLEACKK